MKDLHTYGNVVRDALGDAPRHRGRRRRAVQRQRARQGQATRPRSSGPRTASSARARSSREFVFTETGDTNAGTEAGSAYGGFGGRSEAQPGSRRAPRPARSALIYRGDIAHTGLDNIAFWSARPARRRSRTPATRSTRSATRSTRPGSSTSRADYSDPADAADPDPRRGPRRLGHDRLGARLAANAGFQNDGDNEITGIHVSDGDPTRLGGCSGAKTPRPFEHGWRVFYTQQHGDNVTWEILRKPGRRDWDED